MSSPLWMGKEALLAFGREHEQFDLAALDEVDHLILIATRVDVSVSGNLNGTGIHSLTLQRITQLLFEPVCLRSLLNHDRVSMITLTLCSLRGSGRLLLVQAIDFASFSQALDNLSCSGFV
jgi:hypothetical protein